MKYHSPNPLLQYSQRHGVINHCDRHITLLSDTDISFGLFNLQMYLLIFICFLGDSKQHSKCKRNFEDIFNRTKDLSKSPR
jgi:hypothetical protein